MLRAGPSLFAEVHSQWPWDCKHIADHDRGVLLTEDQQQQQVRCVRANTAAVLTQRVQNIALFPSDPEVMIAGDKEDMLELLDHYLECAPEDGLVV